MIQKMTKSEGQCEFSVLRWSLKIPVWYRPLPWFLEDENKKGELYILFIKPQIFLSCGDYNNFIILTPVVFFLLLPTVALAIAIWIHLENIASLAEDIGKSSHETPIYFGGQQKGRSPPFWCPLFYSSLNGVLLTSNRNSLNFGKTYSPIIKSQRVKILHRAFLWRTNLETVSYQEPYFLTDRGVVS